jgi:hypothetical protein
MDQLHMSIEGALQCFVEAVAVGLVKWLLKMLA